MVEQKRQPSRVICLQAGPVEMDSATVVDVNLRINDRAARVIGRQLALIGDQWVRDRAVLQPNPFPTPLHIVRPAQALTRAIYRDIRNTLVAVQSLSATAKAWLAANQGVLSAEAWASNIHRRNCTGWTTGVLVTVVLAALTSICTSLWVEWKG